MARVEEVTHSAWDWFLSALQHTCVVSSDLESYHVIMVINNGKGQDKALCCFADLCNLPDQ